MPRNSSFPPSLCLSRPCDFFKTKMNWEDSRDEMMKADHFTRLTWNKAGLCHDICVATSSSKESILPCPHLAFLKHCKNRTHEFTQIEEGGKGGWKREWKMKHLTLEFLSGPSAKFRSAQHKLDKMSGCKSHLLLSCSPITSTLSRKISHGKDKVTSRTAKRRFFPQTLDQCDGVVVYFERECNEIQRVTHLSHIFLLLRIPPSESLI